MAVADQRPREVGIAAALMAEQLALDAVGAGQPPGRGGEAPRQHRLERAVRRQLLDQRRLEGGELGGILIRKHHVLLRAKTVLERVLRRARLALGASSGRMTSRRCDGWPRRGH